MNAHTRPQWRDVDKANVHVWFVHIPFGFCTHSAVECINVAFDIFAYIRACTNIVLLQNKKCVQNMKNNGTLSQMKGCIVGFDHGGSHLWAAPDCEGNLALFSVVHRQALQHQATKAGSSATTASVVHTETLQSWAAPKGCECHGYHGQSPNDPTSKPKAPKSQKMNDCNSTIEQKRTRFSVLWPVQLSASLRIRSSTKSTISLPMV